MKHKHTPVLLSETINYLNLKPDNWYLDATFGRGGHTAALLQKGAKVIATDWDEEAIAFGRDHFAAEISQGKLVLYRASFSELAQVIAAHTADISGVLCDFGTSMDQLTSGTRGFSFHEDGPLDMRMDNRLGVTAHDLLMVLSEKQLAQVFADWGGEAEARKIARALKSAPSMPRTTTQLAELVKKTKRIRSGHLHPATKVFQALRIAVNSELQEIKTVLEYVSTNIKRGRLVTIAFHEGEDSLVKQAMKEWESKGIGVRLTTKPISATPEEVIQNPASRSAKLRAFEYYT